MAYREFDTPNLSRRALLRGGAWLTAGAALAGAPLGRQTPQRGRRQRRRTTKEFLGDPQGYFQGI